METPLLAKPVERKPPSSRIMRIACIIAVSYIILSHGPLESIDRAICAWVDQSLWRLSIALFIFALWTILLAYSVDRTMYMYTHRREDMGKWSNRVVDIATGLDVTVWVLVKIGVLQSFDNWVSQWVGNSPLRFGFGLGLLLWTLLAIAMGIHHAFQTFRKRRVTMTQLKSDGDK